MHMLIPKKQWTLFLDRDGVINIEKENDYIHCWEEFVWYDGAVEAIALFTGLFKRIIVVTNQKGIGKGVTRQEDVMDIHQRMRQRVELAGGFIDGIFFCPDTSSNSPNRKPNPGMAYAAKEAFPDIDLSESVMVGNNLSDLHFGRNAGMRTVFLRTTQPQLLLPQGLVDEEAPSLYALALRWQKNSQ
jgi:D-glycero-D-manno-heptose 1,7-bisphosphate phosphatase